MILISATHAWCMDITQLGLILAAVLGVLIVGLAAIVPNVMDWPTHAR